MLTFIKRGTPSNLIFSCLIRSYSTSNTQRDSLSVEKEWFQPNKKLEDALENAKQKNKPLYVYLEGPSGAGKQQLIERMSNIGYKTISNPFFSFVKQSNHSGNVNLSKQWDKFLIDSILKEEKENPIENIKNNIIFVHRSPILSPIIYNQKEPLPILNEEEEDEIDQKQIDKFNEIVESIKKQYQDDRIKNSTISNQESVTIYCKTPIELIQQRIGGRYHFYEDSDIDIVYNFKFKEYQDFSFKVYDRLVQSQQCFDGVLDTTSIKQACPSLLALFNIYFNNTTNMNNSNFPFPFPPRPSKK
eukprot:gene7382-9067_t